MRALTLVGALALLAGCGAKNPIGASDAGSSPITDAGNLADAGSFLTDAQVEALVGGYRGFTKVNHATFETQSHAGNDQVNVWVNDTALASYRTVGNGFSGPFPLGSMIVKEMFLSDGGIDALTAMYKQPAGFNPSAHDWWWGRLNADGTAAPGGYVGKDSSKVGFCISCHMAAEDTDLAFGAGNSH